MRKTIKFLQSYWRAILTALIIFSLTTLSASELNKIPNLPLVGIDKFAHFGVFFILTIFLMIDLQKQTRFKTSTIIYIVLAICFIYGGMIELIQHFFIVSRAGSIFDLLADMMGSVIACIIQAKYKLVRF